MKLLINQVGFDPHAPKQALLQHSQAALTPGPLRVRRLSDDAVVLRVPFGPEESVPGWQGRHFWRADLSALTAPGRYRLEVVTDQGTLRSARFEVGERLLARQCLSDVVHYLKGQRCSGLFERADRSARIHGREARRDVHGGWYDASGDVSKYLSHLSYANYMNPQQTPLVVWSLLTCRERLARREDIDSQNLARRLTDEALHGADFLCRMHDESGFFYMTLFDRWSKDPEQRTLCAYATQQGITSIDYQAGFRQGGGMAIAALARAAREAHGAEFAPAHYAAVAEAGYRHLREHNLAYLDDGRENIIDEYCALLAAVELTHTLGNEWLGEARHWATRLAQRLRRHPDGGHYWSANDDGSRPYYHAVEAGLPGLALMAYLEIEPEPVRRAEALACLKGSLNGELARSAAPGNPFALARQYVKGVDEPARVAFFMPHHNESGYWWQGENARLASLAALAFAARPWLPHLASALTAYGQHQLDWILGNNPFDACMLAGHGCNNPSYTAGWPNALGGICNGITAGVEDEQDIAFIPEAYQARLDQNWRWGEQWLPHAAWFALAITLQGEAHG